MTATLSQIIMKISPLLMIVKNPPAEQVALGCP